MKKAVVSWFFDSIEPSYHNLAYIQFQRALLRILVAIICLVYLHEHGPFYSFYAKSFQATIALYLLYNIYIFYTVRRYPSSILRVIVSTVLDVYIVSFGLVIDGGNSSGLSLIYLLIIFGNTLRFGNMILFFTQALCLAGLVTATALSLQQLQTDTSWSLLMFQIAALVILPLYTLNMDRHFDSDQHKLPDAGQLSLGLLDLGSLPAFIYHLDEHLSPRILYTNPALQMVCHEPIGRLVGQQVDMLALLEDGNIIIDHCRRTLQNTSSEPSRFFLRGHNASADILRLMGETTRIRWRSQWIGLCFIFDITEQEKQRIFTERAQRAGYMGTFVAGIVHDFRNVLTSIIGQAEILQMDLDNPQSTANLERIIQAGERGANMVSQLLALGLGSVKEDNDNYDGDSGATLEMMVNMMRLQLPEKVNLSCEIDPMLPASDLPTSEIEQIIFNLIQNAYQAIPAEGSVNVRITSCTDSPVSENDNPAILIRVEDTGSGISKDDMDYIFTPFWGTHKDIGCAGLGLSTIKRIVGQYHGKIYVQSIPNQGSVFDVHLPAHAKPTHQNFVTSEHAKSTGTTKLNVIRTTTPWRILLVDDSPIVLQAHLAMLTRMGHQVIAETDAHSALSHFNKPGHETFDLIITDYRMPNIDGLHFIQRLRDRGIRTPIVLLTAYAEEERMQKLTSLDVGIIHKPVSYQGLSAYIAAVQASHKSEFS